MERQASDKNILNQFCNDFCEILEDHVEYIVVSGFVAIASGRTRGTEDIDIIIREMKRNDFEELHKNLVERGFVCIQSPDSDEIYDYLKNKTSVRYSRKDVPLPEIELKFGKDKLDDYQFKTKERLPLIGLNVWFSSVNMNVAFKEELLKSPKDLEDADYLRKIYKDRINEEEIGKVKQMINELRL
ncbi:MAG: hypothetical protein GF368_04985 [Candidatus Aenigmarchaeota archaeon]|nr:hypothetical protein [Candidatus Aenigmarchaeota archaeon]